MLNGSMKLWKGIFDKLDRGTMLKDLCAMYTEVGFVKEILGILPKCSITV